jgi:hypothetical protein
VINKTGLAVDWPHYSAGKYGATRRQAEQPGRGVW